MKKIVVWVGACLCILVVVTVAVVYVREQFNTQEHIPITVRLNWLHQAQFAGFYVAREKGFYAEEGLDVTLNEFDFSIDQGEELTSGVVDFAVMSGQELISFVDRGNPLKAIGAVYQISPYAFASLKEHDITTPIDLRGKTLGMAGGNLQARVTYEALLNQYNIATEEVTFKELGFETPQDIATNQADIADLYRTDQTYLLNQMGIEYNLLLPEQFDFGIYGDVIVTRNDIIENDPLLAKKFLRATLRGWEYALTHIDETLEIVAVYENEQYKDSAHERFILEQSIPLITPTGNNELGDMQYLRWKKTFDAMENAEVIKSNMDVDDVFTFTILEE